MHKTKANIREQEQLATRIDFLQLPSYQEIVAKYSNKYSIEKEREFTITFPYDYSLHCVMRNEIFSRGKLIRGHVCPFTIKSRKHGEN